MAEEKRASSEAIPQSGGQGWRAVSVVVSISLASLLLMEVNFLNNRHFYRFDVTGAKRYSISPKSIQIVRSLDAPVRVKTTFTLDGDHHLMARELLTEYSRYSKEFVLGDNLNFVNDPGGLQQFALRYKFATVSEVMNKIVLDYKDGERTRIVKAEDLMSYGQFDPRTGRRGEGRFIGEEKITSALLDLTEEKKTGVYFTVGHAEKDIRTLSSPGISNWRRYLELENFKVGTIDLLSKEELPEDGDVIVVAGPTDRFRPEEEAVLKGFLDGGGRVLLLLGGATRPGLAGILSDWGVDLRDDLIVQKSITPTYIVVGEYRPHPITNPIRGQRITPFLARSVDLVQPLPAGIEGSVLFDSPPETWGETDYRGRRVLKQDPDDHEGPLPMAVALERKGEDEQVARLVVVGSASFVENGQSIPGIVPGVIEEGANDDFALNLVGWLAERERVVGLGGKRVSIPKVRPLSRGDVITIYLVCLAIIPGICLVAGLSIWYVRRG